MLDVKLVVVGGDAKSAEVRLKLPTVIGRGKEASLTVPHALVSRRHTEIFEKDGKLFVRDLGSLNGTFVNNLKIEGDKPLEPNQLLTLGNITFRAVYSIQGDTAESATETETISFDEIKTEAANSLPKMDINSDETVPVDELRASIGPIFTDPPVDNELANPTTSDLEDAENSDSTEDVVSDTEGQAGISADDTDKSFKTVAEDGESISNIFSFDEEVSADQSVALSALDDLPPAQPAAVSFVGKVDFGDNAPAGASQIDSIEIDLGDEKKSNQIGGDTGLGSFLKKLPK